MARPRIEGSENAKTVCITLTSSVLAKLDAYCAEKGKSRSEVVRALIGRLS